MALVNSYHFDGSLETPLLVDDFSGTSLDTDKWSEDTDGATVTVNDQLQITGSGSGTTSATVTSLDSHGLSGSRAFTEIIVDNIPANPDGDFIYTEFMLGKDSDFLWWRVYKEAGFSNVGAFKTVSGTNTEVFTATHDDADYRWLRIREESGTAYWESSPDGDNWVVRHSESTPVPITPMEVIFYGETSGVEATVAYDNFSWIQESGIHDPDNVWNNPENAFDGDDETSASTTSTGSFTSGYLQGIGTTATSGADITQVRARVRSGGSPGANLRSRILSNSQSLGEINFTPGGVIRWSDYITLSNPTGGWSWDKVQDLRVRNWLNNSGSIGLFKVELEVTSEAATADLEIGVGVDTDTNTATSSEAETGAKVGVGAETKTATSKDALVGTGVGISSFALGSDVEAGVPRKTYAYKVYDDNDNFLGQWIDVINEFSYTQDINSPGAVTEVELARNSDSVTTELEGLTTDEGDPILDKDGRQLLAAVESRNQIGPDSTVDHNHRVDVFVYYGFTSPLTTLGGSPILTSGGEPILATSGAPNGRRIFTGFISEITTQYGDTETTKVELTSYGYDLDHYIIEDEGNTTVPFNSYDPSNIVGDSLNQFTSRGGLISPSAGIELTGESESYTFRVNTFLEVLEKAVDLAPPDWFFRVDLGSNEVIFREKSETPEHVFRLGEEIQQLALVSYIGDVVNDVYFTGGEVGDPPLNLFRRYTQTPAPKTRRGLWRRTDNRVTLTSTADTIANTTIARKNRVQYRTELSVLDKVYDIETIELGDVVGFANFGNYVDTIELQVVSITYRPDRVTMTLDTMIKDINRVIDDLQRGQDESDVQNNPDAPTQV